MILYMQRKKGRKKEQMSSDMADRALQHRRLHNLLLIQKLLGLRESSPFTLVLDTVEQSAKPLIRHYIHNAKVRNVLLYARSIRSCWMILQLSKIDVVYISFETLNPPPGVTTFIKARRKDAATIQKELASLISPTKRTPHSQLPHPIKLKPSPQEPS